MRDPLPALGFLLGLALAVYGVASLTGAWLGTPPWWDTEVWAEEESAEVRFVVVEDEDGFAWSDPPSFSTPRGRTKYLARKLRADRQMYSAGVLAAGLLLATSCAWPRRLPSVESRLSNRP